MSSGAKKSPKCNENNGECPMHKYFPIFVGILVVLYAIYSYDTKRFHEEAEKFAALKPLDSLFRFIDEYSPFHEFLHEDETDVLMTKEQLSKYDGSPGSPGLYLAVLGQIFDVSAGQEHYGPGGGYSFFCGRDGSRAFVTGDFEESGLIDDVSGLTYGDYNGLEEWVQFYHKDYKYVGKLIGRFYDKNGRETNYNLEVQKWIRSAREDTENLNAEKQMFPPCNSEWSHDKGRRVWCTKKSGGIHRKWIGVPRKLFYPGRQERCACVRTTGPPSTDPGAKTDFGDLKNVHLKEYDGCDPKAESCVIPDNNNN